MTAICNYKLGMKSTISHLNTVDIQHCDLMKNFSHPASVRLNQAAHSFCCPHLSYFKSSTNMLLRYTSNIVLIKSMNVDKNIK